MTTSDTEGNRDAAGTTKMLPRVLPVSRGDKEWYLDAARTGLLFGVANHRRTGSASSRWPVERFGQTRAATFSLIMVRRRLLCMRLGTGHPGATLVSLHTVRVRRRN